MNPEIKQRIEQIKAGQVPEGYKKTKVGIVPEEWEVRKLKETLEKQTMKNKDNVVKNVLTNSATKGIISQTDFFDKQIANSDNTSGYYVVKNGYFVYNPRISVSAPCGPFNKYYGNKDGIMSPLYTVYKYKSASEYHSEFLSLYFSGSSWYSYMNSIANYGARNDRMNVSSEDMDNMPLPFPPLAEQEKITKVLSTQDKLIELQQKKTEELQKLKKIYLNKMFPKKGENVPEWRFNGFTDAWEQRKLLELFEYIGNAFVGTATPYYVENGHFYLESNNIKDGQINHNTEIFINDEFYDKQKDNWLHTGDMVMVQSGHVGHAAVIPEELNNSAAHALIMFRNPSDEVESNFLNYQYQTMKIKKKIDTITTGNTIKHILASDMQEFEVDLPNLEEQKQIARYFVNLDRLITLHQRKLEEMKKQKKSLMQLLLTGIVRCK